MKMGANLLHTFAAPGVLCIAAFLIACGGSADKTSDATTGPAANGSSDSSAPAAAADSQDKEEAGIFAGFGDAGGEQLVVPPGTNTLLGGTPYYATAAQIKDSLTSNGISLDGLDIYLLPISGTDGSLLVIQGDANAATGDDAGIPDDATPILTALLNSDAVKAAKITRVAMNFLSEDEQGPLVLTITMPVETLNKLLTETLSDEEAAANLKIGIERP
jgi:hypothetical protein